MHKLSDYDFHLPPELIAQAPLPVRDQSRLLVLHRQNGQIEHRRFTDLIEHLNPGDCLVINDTRVLPARLYGQKESGGGTVEIVLLKQERLNEWEALVRPGRRVRPGARLVFGEGQLRAEVLSVTDSGGRILRFEYDGEFMQVLDQLGEMPLPPYIQETLPDGERYQTVYAREHGSVAAPTAGLHFTEEYIGLLRDKGVHIAPLTLHVGLGTFRPVQVDDITEHAMHAEYYCLTPESADLINTAHQQGKRVVAVGTTSARTLETVGQADGSVKAGSGWTDIFIYPGYEFKVLDGMITNFHLPKSTLIMLVSALAGRELVLKAYEAAVAERYRFYSFGDAMLII